MMNEECAHNPHKLAIKNQWEKGFVAGYFMGIIMGIIISILFLVL